jgi:hypothetical protein
MRHHLNIFIYMIQASYVYIVGSVWEKENEKNIAREIKLGFEILFGAKHGLNFRTVREKSSGVYNFVTTAWKRAELPNSMRNKFVFGPLKTSGRIQWEITFSLPLTLSPLVSRGNRSHASHTRT